MCSSVRTIRKSVRNMIPCEKRDFGFVGDIKKKRTHDCKYKIKSQSEYLFRIKKQITINYEF